MIHETVNYLTSISDLEWGLYAISRDPLNKKINPDITEELIQRSIQCGKGQAQNLLSKYPNHSVKEIAQKMNLEIRMKDSYGTDNYIMFACYNSPNSITLFKNNIELEKDFLIQEDLFQKLEDVNIEDLLIAHEMFHYLEENDQSIYTRTTKIELWRIGKFIYKSKLIALGEMAAMSFAKEILSLGYNPFVFDVLMLYAHDKEKTNNLLNEIKEIIKRS